jgi:D-glycero-D-manno-heptose 1,7-bisphosphate phosphatase
LAKFDYGVFFVTNQAGITEGRLSLDEFEAINNKVLELIAPSGIRIIHTYVCPHGENSTCAYRKPKPKLLLDAASDYAIDLPSSYTIGDRPSDVLAGVNAGTKTILVQTGVAIPPEDYEATFTAPTLFEAVRYIPNGN